MMAISYILLFCTVNYEGFEFHNTWVIARKYTSGLLGDYQPKRLKSDNRLIRIESRSIATLRVLLKSRYYSSWQDPRTLMRCHIMFVVTTLFEESWKLRLKTNRFNVAVRVPSNSKMTTNTSPGDMTCHDMTSLWRQARDSYCAWQPWGVGAQESWMVGRWHK